MGFRVYMRGLLEDGRAVLGRAYKALRLAALGLMTGIVAGTVIVAFRGAIQGLETIVAPDGFAALAPALRVALPVAGTLIAIILLAAAGRGRLSTGVVHALRRLKLERRTLPLKNAVVQFFGAAVLLGFGLPMGQEGPGVHLGAASGSLLGQQFGVSPERLRTVAGCGVAAAIAAFFNTPLAGVMLAMEVVLMEYTVDGFLPVILAAVSGAALGRIIYGDNPAFLVPPLTLHSLWELPYILAMGVAIGAFAAAFITLVRTIIRATRRWVWWMRVLAGGGLAGLCSAAVPQAMGVGYDTVNLIFAGVYGFGPLLAIAAVKFLASGLGVGAGLPAGLIGPTLVMGAAAGGVLGHIGAALVHADASDVSLYAMLGMGAMMGAVLKAPLAALLAMLELTGDLHIVFPGMLAIVSASLSARALFGCDSIFSMQLRELPPGYGDEKSANTPLA